MTINELKNSTEYRLHHTASRRGYISRKCEGQIEHYNERFGEGYIIVTPRWDTTQYVDIAYYIKAE